MTTHNAQTRALLSALKSGIPLLVDTACDIIRTVVRSDPDRTPGRALMHEFNASDNTAYRLLKEWEKRR